MPSTADLKPTGKIRALVYGLAKVGKTYGAATFPRPNFVSFDPDGMVTLVGKDFRTKHPGRFVTYETFSEVDRNKQGVIRTHNAFDDACKYFDAWMNPRGAEWKSRDGSVTKCHPDEFDTWVIDSGTTASEAALNKAIVLLGGKDFAIASKTHATAINSGLIFPRIQDYGSERSMFEQFVQMFLDTQKHVILLCHEKEVSNDDGKVTAIVPLLTGKSVASISLKFTELWNLRATRSGPDLKRTLLTQTDGRRMAGSRIGIATGTEWNYDAIVGQL